MKFFLYSIWQLFVFIGCIFFLTPPIIVDAQTSIKGKSMMENTKNVEAAKVLEEGFRRFQELHFCCPDSPYKKGLSEGQEPRVLFISCSDSRVDPAILTDANPGELFVVRNISNLVPPCTTADENFHGVTAAIEYAVQHLHVDTIIIMGHAKCGGIHSLLQPGSYTGTSFIDRWMSIARPAKILAEKKFPNAPFEVVQKACEQLSVVNSMNNIVTFPWVQDAIKKSNLKLYGWYFDIVTGELLQYDPMKKEFIVLVPAC